MIYAVSNTRKTALTVCPFYQQLKERITRLKKTVKNISILSRAIYDESEK